MKKLFVAVVAIAALCACGSGEKKYLDYRGLSMGMPFKTFCDSLMARGFAIDSAKTDSDFATVSMFNPNLNYRIMMAQKNDTLVALQERPGSSDIRLDIGVGPKKLKVSTRLRS